MYLKKGKTLRRGRSLKFSVIYAYRLKPDLGPEISEALLRSLL
jgi:hypothetical protein